MSKVNIVIADNEEKYIEKLCEYILERYSIKYNIYCFSNNESLHTFCRENSEEIDLWLLGKDFYKLSGVESEKKILFCQENDSSEGAYVIDKYQNVDTVIDKIEMFVSSMNSVITKPIKKNSGTDIITFYSPIGGAGKSTLSVNSAVLLAQKKLNVIYLSLDDYDWFSDNTKAMSAVLYGVKSKADGMSFKISKAIKKNDELGIHTITSFESVSELELFGEADLEFLINEICKLDKFDYLIIDLSSAFTKRNMYCMSRSNRVVLIDNPGVIEKEKLLRFRSEPSIVSNSVGSKSINVLNRYRGGEANGDIVISEMDYAPSPYDFIKGINTSSDYSKGVLKLVERFAY